MSLLAELNLPTWLPTVVVWLGIIGFPFVAMFSWIYELTPEGLKRESEISRTSGRPLRCYRSTIFRPIPSRPSLPMAWRRT